jgi:hypothetical protein
MPRVYILTDTIANIELQMASIHGENETLKGQMVKLEEKIKTLENHPTVIPKGPSQTWLATNCRLDPNPQLWILQINPQARNRV